MQLGRDQLTGPACWVCGVRFKSATPPGPANREDHHICPRNAGGTDGPLVSLCDSHHTGLHKIAQRIQRRAKFDDLLHGEAAESVKKLVWLAGQVVVSEQRGDADPDKRLVGSVSLSQQETEMMKKIQSLTGKSRNEILRAGLILVFKRYFG